MEINREKIGEVTEEFSRIVSEFKIKIDTLMNKYDGIDILFNHKEDYDEKENSWCLMVIDYDKIKESSKE